MLGIKQVAASQKGLSSMKSVIRLTSDKSMLIHEMNGNALC
jgi:hypothetical protein